MVQVFVVLVQVDYLDLFVSVVVDGQFQVFLGGDYIFVGVIGCLVFFVFYDDEQFVYDIFWGDSEIMVYLELVCWCMYFG